MSDMPLRARSVTEIVDALFQLYRRHAVQFILVAALVYAPWLALQFAFFRDLLTVSLSGGSAVWGRADYWVSMMGSFIAYAAMTGILIKTASRAYLHGETGEVAGAVREALPKVLSILLGAVLRILAFALAAAPMLLGLIHPILYLVGTFAMCFGMPYLFARFVVAIPVIVLEDSNAFAAMRRASTLTRGRTWHILGTYLLLGLIYFVLSAGVMLAVGTLSSTPLLMAILMAFSIIVYPAFGLTEMLLYYDMRVRNEGYDLELMAESLDQPAVAAR